MNKNQQKQSGKYKSESINMKSHKLQINLLNAITISDSSNGNTGRLLSPSQSSSSLVLVMLTALMLLAVGSYFTDNCNKLSDNSHRHSGRDHWHKNCTPATDNSTAIIIDNNSNSNSQSIGSESEIGSGQQNGGHTALQRQNDYMRKIEAALMRIESTSINDKDAQQRKRTRDRTKRFLTFSGNGVVKLVFGISVPIQLAARQRSLSNFYNFHLQYTPPPRPLYWWSLYNSSTFAVRRQKRHLHEGPFLRTTALPFDTSRAFIYAVIENFLEREGLPGGACLLQTICNVSHQPFHGGGGIFHALLNAILAPNLPNVAAKYLNAQRAGRFGVDCMRTFNECPTEKNFLKAISYLV